MKEIFQTKKFFMTCSKLMINKLGRCPTRSENVYFANNEQASIAVFTAVFCFAHAEHDLIKLTFDQHKLLTEYFGVCYVKFKETNQISSPLKISQSINAE